MRFSDSILVADLQEPHPEYDAEQIVDHNYFYEGGRNFPCDTYLHKKLIETCKVEGYHQGGVGDIRQVRVDAAYYANHFAGVINELLSAIVYDPPQFCSPSNDAYWTALNADADGLGGPISLQVMQSLWSRMMFGRSYYQVVFPPTPKASRKAQEDSGGLRAQIIQLRGDVVDDWQYGPDRKLQYIRKHVKCYERADPDAPAGPRPIEKHYWIYHAREGIYTYSASIDTDKEKEFQKGAVAELANEPQKNASGVFQIVEVRSALDVFVGDALFPVAKQIFNASSDSSYARRTSATCTPVLASENDPGEVLKLGPFNLLNVGVNGKLTFATAPAEFFTALDAAEEKHKAELYMQVHSMAAATKAAANSGQNVSRESGAAITKKQGPLHAFLQAFAAGEIAALNQCAEIVQKVRRNPERVTLDGLEEYDTDDLDENIDRATKLKEIPQTPPPVMEMLMKSVGGEMADRLDADPETKEKISNYVTPGGKESRDQQSVALTITRLAAQRDEMLAINDVERANEFQTKIDELVRFI